MDSTEKRQNNNRGGAPLSTVQSLRAYPPRMFGGGNVTGGRVPVAGSGMLGSAVAGCVILCRVIVYRTGGGGVVGGGVVGCAVTLYRATFRLIGR